MEGVPNLASNAVCRLYLTLCNPLYKYECMTEGIAVRSHQIAECIKLMFESEFVRLRVDLLEKDNVRTTPFDSCDETKHVGTPYGYDSSLDNFVWHILNKGYLLIMINYKYSQNFWIAKTFGRELYHPTKIYLELRTILNEKCKDNPKAEYYLIQDKYVYIRKSIDDVVEEPIKR